MLQGKKRLFLGLAAAAILSVAAVPAGAATFYSVRGQACPLWLQQAQRAVAQPVRQLRRLSQPRLLAAGHAQASPTVAAAQPWGTMAAPDQAGPTAEGQMVALVNAARMQRALQPLVADPNLTDVARLKSRDMAERGYFSHTSPTYGDPFAMLRHFGIGYRTAGENLALNHSAQAAFQALMNSPGHRQNILNPEFSRIGVGAATGTQGLLFTQLFAG